MRPISVPRSLRTFAFAVVLAGVVGVPANAAQLEISVTNNQPAGGFAFSPVWVGIHDGTFKTYDPGTSASSALQHVAELADNSLLSAAFSGHGPQTTIGSAPYGPGTSHASVLDVADPATDRFLNFASMVVPSNDFFMGNADPEKFQLFDAAGNFQGPLTIQVFGRQVWDAGTEVDNINFGAAFIVGDNITDHVAENGLISPVFGGSTDFTPYLDSISGRATPYGYNISHLISPNDLIATITVQAVPEPSSLALMGIGAGGLMTAMRLGRRRRASGTS